MRSQTYAVFTVKKKMHPAMTRRHLRRWKRAPRRGRRRTRPDEALPRPRSGSLHQLRRPRKAVKPDFALEPVTTACVRGGISPTDLDHGIWQWLADDDLDWLIMTLGHHWCRNRVPSLCSSFNNLSRSSGVKSDVVTVKPPHVRACHKTRSTVVWRSSGGAIFSMHGVC